jgi:transposase
MITYEVYCAIEDCCQNQHLTVPQIARKLNLDRRTVAQWITKQKYDRRQPVKRPSKLDRYKPQILRWLEAHPYTATQIFQRLGQDGYTGGITIVKQYVRKVRPPRAKAFLTLSFASGECAQLDWGQHGSIVVGQTRRRLSFLVMVLCHSRMLYLQFTLGEKMEHFLDCQQNAFAFFGAVPAKTMVDNLRSAVLQRIVGEAPVLNPRYKDFADHYGFKIVPCGVGQPHEKGRVENSVGYVKKNFLSGLEISDFALLNPAARHWMDTVANVRLHGTTKRRPVDMFATEKPYLKSLSPQPYDVGVIEPARASSRFRVTVDTNHYSVPAEYASNQLTLKRYPDQLCVYHQEKLVARHVRSYERHRDFEDPDHPRALLQQRRRARDQKLLQRLLMLSRKAEPFYLQLQQRRLNVPHHIRKIVALSEIYGPEKTARAIEDALEFEAFSCEYVANLLEQRQRLLPELGALHLTRREDLLDLELPEPNLTVYDTDDGPSEASQEKNHHEPKDKPEES